MTEQEQDTDENGTPVVAITRAGQGKGLRLGLTPPAPTFGTIGVVALLVAVAFSRVMGKHQMRRLRSSTGPLLVCVTVPDRSWFEPLREAAKAMVRVPAVHVWDSTARRTGGDPSVDEVVRQVTKGRAVLCVSQDVAAAVPRSIRTVAEAKISLTQPWAADIALAISIVRGGRGPSDVPPDLGKGLELHEVAACLRGGEAPRVTVARIRKAMAGKHVVGIDETAPRLEDLHGYGEAAAWGRRVVSEVDDFRAGRLPWFGVTGPAVLHGPPGTGKSLYARALARSLGVPLVTTSVSGWFAAVGSGDLGATIRSANAAFDEARALVRDGGVAVLFVDEIDSLPNRSALDADRGSWWRPVVNQVLTLVDGATSDLQRIVLLAATNDLRAVDPALLRPGRFGTALEVLPPSIEDLAGVVRHHLGGAACPLPWSDIAAVLGPLAGATQARAAAWASEATRSANAAGRPVRLDDLLAVALPADGRPEARRRRVAVHEAGHAVAAHHLARTRLVSVSVVESIRMHGSTTMMVQDEALLDLDEMETEVVLALVGRAADVVVGSGANAGAGGTGFGAETSDLAVATRLLGAVHATYGLGQTLRHRGGTAIGRPDDEVDRRVEADLRRLMARAEEFVTAHAAEVRAVVEALLERRFLTAAEVGDVIAAVRAQGPSRGGTNASGKPP